MHNKCGGLYGNLAETKYTASTHLTELEEGNQEEKTPKDTMKVSNNFIPLSFDFVTLD